MGVCETRLGLQFSRCPSSRPSYYERLLTYFPSNESWIFVQDIQQGGKAWKEREENAKKGNVVMVVRGRGKLSVPSEKVTSMIVITTLLSSTDEKVAAAVFVRECVGNLRGEPSIIARQLEHRSSSAVIEPCSAISCKRGDDRFIGASFL
jgi:hypothetical protein